MKKNNTIAAVLAFVAATVVPDTLTAQQLNIKNDTFWNTGDGQPIYSQGGGIFRFKDPVTDHEKYYWYGVHYDEADQYRSNPAVTLSNPHFYSVTCYTSADLVNWHFEADVLTRQELKKNAPRPTWVGRLGVAYLPQLRKYAMFVQHGGKVLITVADSPAGQFTWHRQLDMTAMIGTSNTGDQTVFTDPDNGKSYLIYSYGRGRNKIYVSEIGVKNGMVALMDCTQVFAGESREGNCMFKHDGHYYMVASNIYGWDASFAYYLVADDIRGPYLPANDMQVMEGCAADYAHVTQTGFFVNAGNTVVYCGDRWANLAGNGLGYNQWFPLSFDGKKPYFNSLSSWHLEAATGSWSVAADNNYVRNGSFEADRNRIPSNRKPVQQQLLGWKTEILQGAQLSLTDSSAPALNHFNTEEDRQLVMGEKSLAIADKIPFRRKVSQVISSTPYVPLQDGNYTLSLKLKNSTGFAQLEVYANTATETVTRDIKDAHATWTIITLKDIPVKGGRVEIGFDAAGGANAYCYIDDVELVKR